MRRGEPHGTAPGGEDRVGHVWPLGMTVASAYASFLRGFSQAMHAESQGQPGSAQIVQAVAQGEAALGVFLVTVLTPPSVDLIGPFPAALQQEVVFTAAVAAHTTEAKAAEACLTSLTTPAATAVLQAKGMRPG